MGREGCRGICEKTARGMKTDMRIVERGGRKEQREGEEREACVIRS